MSKQKSFGIGCFHFGVRKIPPFNFKGSDYLLELNKALSKISSLTNLKIDSDEEFKEVELSITEPIENLNHNKGSFPYALILDVEFDIYIPYRIQAELSETEEKFLSTFTENFRVRIFQSFYLPVAIIESINPTEENDPSIAVQIVREYIDRELTEIKSEYIRFEYLGPSPFHCDFFIAPQETEEVEEIDDWLFNPVEEIKKGYDSLIIYYNPTKINDADEVLDYLDDSIRDEFGFFYRCIQMRNSKMHDWESIKENLSTLLGIQKIKGLKGTFQRSFKRPRLIEKLFTDIATFEGNDIFLGSIQRNEYKATFSVKDETFFKTFIDKELQEVVNYPVKQTTELIHFFESRRIKSLEITTALISAILGGTIGALLTISLQNRQFQTSSSTNKSIEKTTQNNPMPKSKTDIKKKGVVNYKNEINPN